MGEGSGRWSGGRGPLWLGLAVTQPMLGTPAGSCCLWACPSHPREKGVRPPCWGGPEPVPSCHCGPAGGLSALSEEGAQVRGTGWRWGVLGARCLLATLLEGAGAAHMWPGPEWGSVLRDPGGTAFVCRCLPWDHLPLVLSSAASVLCEGFTREPAHRHSSRGLMAAPTPPTAGMGRPSVDACAGVTWGCCDDDHA